MKRELSVEEKKVAIEAIRNLAEFLGIDLKECVNDYPQLGWHVLNDGTVVPPAERDWSLIRGIWIKNGYCAEIELIGKQRMYLHSLEACQSMGCFLAPQDIYDLIRDNLATFNYSLELVGKKPLNPVNTYWMMTSADLSSSYYPAYNMLDGTISNHLDILDLSYIAIFLHEPKTKDHE